MYSFNKYLVEAFDKSLPSQRIKPSYAWVLDQWSFEYKNAEHMIMFRQNRNIGKKVSIVMFGKKKAKSISKNLNDVTDVRLYLSTVYNAIQNALDEPTLKLKTKKDGLILIVPNKLFEKFGKRFIKILSIKLRQTHKVHQTYFVSPDASESDSAIYLYKKSMKFENVFSGIEETVEEPADIPEKEVVTITEPVAQINPVEAEKVIPKKIQPVSKKPTKSFQTKLNETYTDEQKRERFYQLFFYNLFEKDNAPPKFKTPFLPIEDYAIVIELGKDMKMNKEKLIISLIRNGIKSLYVSTNVFDGSIWRNNTDKDFKEWIKVTYPSSKKNITDWNTIYKIMLDYEKIADETIMKASGLPEVKMPKYNSKDELRSYRLEKLKMTPEEAGELIEVLLLDIEPVDRKDLFEYSSEGEKFKKSKSVKSKRYDLLDRAVRIYSESINDSDKFFELIEKLPLNAEAISYYSTDYEVFEANLIEAWLRQGGTGAHDLAFLASAGIEINSSIPAGDYWGTEDLTAQNGYETIGFMDLNTKVEVLTHPIMQSHFQKMYDKTQAFYKDKLKKKYDTKVFTLFRGLGTENVNKYIPAPMESWSPSIATAKAFAKMMSAQDGYGTILVAEIPIQYIMGSYESLEEVFVDEKMLKGKKEFIVMGGALSQIPVYEYDASTKEKMSGPKSLKEYMNMNEAKIIGKTIKIVKPKDKDKTTGTGWEANEDLTKAEQKK